MVEANKFPPNAVKVVTERGVVYLMGIVTKAEGDSAGEVAATTDGVGKVVKVFEYRHEPAKPVAPGQFPGAAHGYVSPSARSRIARLPRRW
jgi:hypothetical protein